MVGYMYFFENFGRIRSSVDRIWCLLMVVLIVGCIIYISEFVVFNNILEFFVFGCFYCVDQIVFFEDFFNFQQVINGFFNDIKIVKFYEVLFRISFGFFVVFLKCLRCVFDFCFVKIELYSVVFVCFRGFYLCDYVGFCFNNGVSNIVAQFVEDVGYFYFFIDNIVYQYMVFKICLIIG